MKHLQTKSNRRVNKLQSLSFLLVYYFYQHTYRNHEIKARRGTEGMFGSLANVRAQEKEVVGEGNKDSQGNRRFPERKITKILLCWLLTA